MIARQMPAARRCFRSPDAGVSGCKRDFGENIQQRPQPRYARHAGVAGRANVDRDDWRHASFSPERPAVCAFRRRADAAMPSRVAATDHESRARRIAADYFAGEHDEMVLAGSLSCCHSRS